MPAPDAARQHYATTKRLAVGVARRTAAAWADIDPTALDNSWTRGRVGEQIFVTVAAGQQIAAGLADTYVDAVLAEQSIDATATATVRPAAFAGIAADGRSLETLLYQPIIAVKEAMRTVDTTTAMNRGLRELTRIVGTQIADAGRTAVGTAIAVRPKVTSWTRMLNPPSCSRCAVLAGKTFRWNQGFFRHPLCDCVHIPTTEDAAGDLTTDPRAYFDSLSAADQNRYFTIDGAQAIRDGADIGRVVNAHQRSRGLAVAGQPSSAGTAPPRPEQILATTSDRTEVLNQLLTLGYVT